MSSLLLHKTRVAVHGEPSTYPHFRLVGAKEAARLAAENLPFTEHCHGETVTTMPREPETVSDMLIKMAIGIVCVLVIVALVGIGFADWNHAQMLMARV